MPCSFYGSRTFHFEADEREVCGIPWVLVQVYVPGRLPVLPTSRYMRSQADAETSAHFLGPLEVSVPSILKIASSARWQGCLFSLSTTSSDTILETSLMDLIFLFSTK